MFVVSQFTQKKIVSIVSTPRLVLLHYLIIFGLADRVSSTSPVIYIDDRNTTDLFLFGTYEQTIASQFYAKLVEYTGRS